MKKNSNPSKILLKLSNEEKIQYVMAKALIITKQQQEMNNNEIFNYLVQYYITTVDKQNDLLR